MPHVRPVRDQRVTTPTPEDPVAFPVLTDEQVSVVETFGMRRTTRTGEVLYREGDTAYDFYVVLSGEIDVTIAASGDDQSIARYGPGQFLGELSLLTGLRAFVTTRVTEGGAVLVVPKKQFKNLIATQSGLSDKILAAYIARRSILLSGAAATTRVIGSRFSKETLRIREFLSRLSIPHEWLDPDRHEDVDDVLEHFDVEAMDLPVVITSGTVLRSPSTGQLAEYLGLTLQSLPERGFDLIVVGGGPAGLAASVYGASEGLATLDVERFGVGGQAGTSSRIENYLGFPTGVSGTELAQRALVQAEKFGARMTAPCEAESLREEDGYLIVHLSDGTDVTGRAVIAASGARYRRLTADRLEDFEDAGVYYAATHLEARLCTPGPVVVVGGGNSAGQAAMFLADAGSPVTLVIRGADVGASMSRYLVDRIRAHPVIRVRTQAEVTALDGGATLSTVRIRQQNREETVPCGALFSFIGAEPASGWLSSCAALDDHGFVVTGRMLRDRDLSEAWEALGRAPLPYESSRPGLFAVGDVRSGSVKRVAAAVGEGSACVSSVHEYLAFGEG